MKKLTKIAALALSAAMCVSCLTACSGSSSSAASSEAAAESVGGSGSTNPIETYDSLEALNEAVGGKLTRYTDSVTDDAYSLINMGDSASPIAEYDFTMDGNNYMERFCSDFDAAISGIYEGETTLFSDPAAADFHDLTVVSGDDYYAAHWCTVDGQYVLAVMGCSDDFSAEDFSYMAQDYQAMSVDGGETSGDDDSDGYDSLEDMAQDFACMLYCPNDTAENEIWFSESDSNNGSCAVYCYTLDGRQYEVRFDADFTASFTYLNYDGAYAFSDPDADDFSEFTAIEGSDYYAAHWLTVDGQYVFTALDKSELTLDQFTQIAETYMDGTIAADN